MNLSFKRLVVQMLLCNPAALAVVLAMKEAGAPISVVYTPTRDSAA